MAADAAGSERGVMAILRKAMVISGDIATDCPLGGQCKYQFVANNIKVAGKCGFFDGTHEDERGLFVRCRYRAPPCRS